MRDRRLIRCTYYVESGLDPARAAAVLAGEQSSGTFIDLPGESDRLTERHGAEVVSVRELGECRPSLPSRTHLEKVRSAEVVVEFPMENVGTDVATLLTTIAGNLYELVQLFACRLNSLELPSDLAAAHPGRAFGIDGTRKLLNDPSGVLVGTIVKPNVRMQEDEYRATVRELADAKVDLIKDDELMTDPTDLPLEVRVWVADKDADSAEVHAKRTAAQRWVNHVNDSDSVAQRWRYLLVTETDIAEAKGSWRALKTLSTD